jgi:hypothetical protein
MFNRKKKLQESFHLNSEEYKIEPTNVTITENKAPTDESMRLLDEFRKEVLASVVDRGMFKCSNTNIELSWMKLGFTIENPFDEVIMFRTKVNDKLVKGSIIVNGLNEEEIRDLLTENVAKQIARNLVFGTYHSKGK